MPDSDTTIPWDQLLTDIHKRLVLPIIGPALVTVGSSPLTPREEPSATQILLNVANVPAFAREHGN